MKRQHKYSFALACAALVMFCTGTICYASDAGGIRTMITGWISGEQKQIEAVGDGENGYRFYKDGEEEPFMGGGGVEYDAFGNEKPLSAQDVMDEQSRYVEKREDGTVWIYDREYSANITDLLEDGKAKVIVPHDGHDSYWDIEVEKASTTYTIDDEAPADQEDYIRLH